MKNLSRIRRPRGRDAGRPVEDAVRGLVPQFAFTGEDRPDSVLAAYPNPMRVHEALILLIDAMFPGRLSTDAVTPAGLPAFLRKNLDLAARRLQPEIVRALPFRWLGAAARREGARPRAGVRAEAARVVRAFLARLPEVRARLVEDVRAAYEGDPAALSHAEVKLAYPGLLAITSHRLAHELYRLEVPIVPRIMSEWIHARTGIDIHPGARIGRGFFIDHGTGVVIGETCEIGDRVKLYQGVTLGARSFALDDQGLPVKHIQRHPTVEDDVVIYANATILGGDTVIGRGSIVGGNVFLMESVPPGTKVSTRHPELDKRGKRPPDPRGGGKLRGSV